MSGRRRGHLRQLLGGYLHQDYLRESGSLEGAVQRFAKGEPAHVAAALRELDELAARLSGEALEAELQKLGCAAAEETPEALVARLRRALLTAGAKPPGRG